uniref:Uncharacterized protein n=1 Tax=Cacopsylla melanoneura TaxID=428564 RepID=A0A8D8QR50_9HEMI
MCLPNAEFGDELMRGGYLVMSLYFKCWFIKEDRYLHSTLHYLSYPTFCFSLLISFPASLVTFLILFLLVLFISSSHSVILSFLFPFPTIPQLDAIPIPFSIQPSLSSSHSSLHFHIQYILHLCC